LKKYKYIFYNHTMQSSIQRSILEDSNKFRKNISIQFQLILEKNNDSDYENFSVNIEKAIYNYAIKEANTKKIVKKWDNPQFLHLYMDRLRTIYINMKNVPMLLTQLQQGDITPQQLAFMTHQEMNQDKWKSLIEQKIKRDASKYSTNIEASTDMYTCKKCKSKKCTYYELQTRSADESATIFVTCLNCGKNWRG